MTDKVGENARRAAVLASEHEFYDFRRGEPDPDVLCWRYTSRLVQVRTAGGSSSLSSGLVALIAFSGYAPVKTPVPADARLDGTLIS